jgi:hypothetical protein
MTESSGILLPGPKSSGILGRPARDSASGSLGCVGTLVSLAKM